MAALDLITLADLKTYGLVTGSGRDAVLALYITAASRAIESYVGRRLVFRTPPSIASADDTVASRGFTSESVAGGSITQPSSARTLVVTLTGTPTAGVITVTGTVAGILGTVETFDVANGLVLYGLKFFTAISSVVVSGAAGGGNYKIGTTPGYVEYHTPDGSSDSWPLEWPVAQLLEVNEDVSRTYGSSTALVAGTDYLLTRERRGDHLIRLWGAQPGRWLYGFRSIRKTYSGGYAAASVPGEVKDCCRRLAKLLFDEVDKNRLGMSSVSDAQGNYTRFAAASISPEIAAVLGQYKRNRFGADTGARDFDLEAA